MHVDRTKTDYSALNLTKNGKMANSLKEAVKGPNLASASNVTQHFICDTVVKKTTCQTMDIENNTVVEAAYSIPPPEYPLLPVSKQIQAAAKTLIEKFEMAVNKLLSPHII